MELTISLHPLLAIVQRVNGAVNMHRGKGIHQPPPSLAIVWRVHGVVNTHRRKGIHQPPPSFDHHTEGTWRSQHASWGGYM